MDVNTVNLSIIVMFRNRYVSFDLNINTNHFLVSQLFVLGIRSRELFLNTLSGGTTFDIVGGRVGPFQVKGELGGVRGKLIARFISLLKCMTRVNKFSNLFGVWQSEIMQQIYKFIFI